MDDEALEQLVKVKGKIPFFTDLTEYQIKTLVKNVIFKKFHKGETIFRQDETKNRNIYFVLSGRTKITLRDEYGITKIVTTLPTNSVIGEMQAILDEKRTAGCVADCDNTILIGFSINEYQLGMHGNIYAVFYKNLAAILAEKLTLTNKKVK